MSVAKLARQRPETPQQIQQLVVARTRESAPNGHFRPIFGADVTVRGGFSVAQAIPYFSSLELRPSTRRATTSCWICCVPSKMSRILESRAHFSSRLRSE